MPYQYLDQLAKITLAKVTGGADDAVVEVCLLLLRINPYRFRSLLSGKLGTLIMESLLERNIKMHD